MSEDFTVEFAITVKAVSPMAAISKARAKIAGMKRPPVTTLSSEIDYYVVCESCRKWFRESETWWCEEDGSICGKCIEKEEKPETPDVAQ